MMNRRTLAFLAIRAQLVGIYAWKVNPARSPWRVAGTGVLNVSHAVGAQTEVSAAMTPNAANDFFAASNDTLLRTVRVYTSTTAGRTWSSQPGPPRTERKAPSRLRNSAPHGSQTQSRHFE